MEIISLIISILALSLSIMQFFRESSRKKNESTLIAYKELQDDVFSELTKYPYPMQEIKPGDDKWSEFTVYLAKIEHFCVGINTGDYSIKVLNRLGGSFFIRQFDKLKPIIEEKRRLNTIPGGHADEFEKTVMNLRKYRKELQSTKDGSV